MKYKDLTKEQKRARADYMKEYRKKHPEYMAAQRIREKPHLTRYRQATERNKRLKIIRDYVREGMITEGWKIEVTHVYQGKIQTNTKMISEDMMFNSHNQMLKFTFEEMLNELGIK